MKILFLSAWYPHPPDNGSKLRVNYLLRALAEKHQVYLISFAFDTARPKEKSVLKELCQEVCVVPVNPMQRSTVLKALRFFSPVPIITLPIPSMQYIVREMVSRIQFDVVIASTEIMASYALMLRNMTRILEEHNSLCRLMAERYHSSARPFERLITWASWQKTAAYEARLFSRFDMVTMVSKQDQATSEQLIRNRTSRTRVEIVPNGVDCEYNRPGFVSKQPLSLIYNGALTYSANYDGMAFFLSDIYPLIRVWEPHITLTITGSTMGVNLNALRLDRTVNLTGYVNDIRPLVASSAVCVVPLRRGGGSRLKILEAMALGTPVVSTSKGAEGLDVENEEHILIADSPQDFARNVVRLLRDHDLYERLVSNARRFVEEQHNWREIGARFVRLVEETVKDRLQ